MRLPTFEDLRLFCEHDTWKPKKKTDHYRYTKDLPDGRSLRTKASFGNAQIGDAGLFAAILREQLHVTEAEFWRVVEGRGPAQHTPPLELPAPAGPALSAGTVLKLRKRGVTDQQVRELKSQSEAEELLRTLETRGNM